MQTKWDNMCEEGILKKQRVQKAIGPQYNRWAHWWALKKSNTNIQIEASSTKGNSDKYSLVMRGSGLKEVADWEEIDKIQHVT